MVLAAKITSKGQITLPKEVRKLLNAERGSVIVFEKEDERIFIRRTKTLLEYRGYLRGKKRPIDFDVIREKAKKYLSGKNGCGKRGR
jgi:antitoxin PrlF